MAQGFHPFPSRTRPLSPVAPMVLHCGRVGRRLLLLQASRCPATGGFFYDLHHGKYYGRSPTESVHLAMVVQQHHNISILPSTGLTRRILNFSSSRSIYPVRCVIIFSLLWLNFNSVQAQNIDEWRVYSSFSTINDVVVTDQNVRIVATQGGLFITDSVGNSSTLTTLDGLHRLDIQKLVYHSSSKQLFLGYMDGAIDVYNVETTSLQTINDLLRIDQYPSKSIRDLLIYDDVLYVATDFGIVEFNVDDLYVQQSYIGLGNLDRATPVFAIDIYDNQLIAATSGGIVSANLMDNLIISDSWTVYTKADGLPSNLIQDISFFDGTAYAVVEESLYQLDGETWQKEDGINYLQALDNVHQSQGQDLLLVFNNRIMRRSTYRSTKIYQVDNVRGIRTGTMQSDHLIMGTTDIGLLVFNSPTDWDQFVPLGPYTNFFTDLEWSNDRLFAASSQNVTGDRIIDRSKGYSFFQDSSWISFNAQNTELLDQENFKQAFTTTQNSTHYFIGSWGSGLVKHNKTTNAIQVYNAFNSTLRGWEADNPEYTVISGLSADSKDQVWLVSRYGSEPLYVYEPNQDTWLAHAKDNAVSTLDEYVGLFIDSKNNKWISLQSSTGDGTGLLVMDTNDPMNLQDNQGVKLTTSPSNGNLPDNKVTAFLEDKNGEVWIGTARGIARFLFPQFIVDSQRSSERQSQWLLNEDTAAVSRYLLRDINVSSMAVNGANQKWIGSVNQGLWLLNEEGSTIIKRYTEENSPLISNNILSITVNEESGEVFVATDRGLVSFIDIAQSSKAKMGSLKVYPNPFLYEQHERIIIENLSQSTRIRILNSGGEVVHELQANGGRVQWDGYNSNGQKLSSGVYFIVAWDVDEGERGVGKLVIIQ